MLTDERYGHQLGARLHEELADVHAAPDLMVALRRRRARRAVAVRAAVAVPLVAAAAAAALVTTVDHEGARPDGGAPVELVSVAQVQTQTLQALGRASAYVIYSRSGWTEGGEPDGYYDTWVDKATQRYRNDVYDRSTVGERTTGNEPSSGGVAKAPPPPSEMKRPPIRLSQSHAAKGPLGDRIIVSVDHLRRNWTRDRDTFTPPPPATPDITDPDSVRKAIAKGTVELLGREKVAGRDTFHLRVYGPKRSYRIDMWVDSKSYLPVREAAAKAVDGGFPPSATVTTTYSWLPRTEENLARLVLTPPPGFKRVG